MKKMRAALAAMTIVALTFTACSGDDGEQGPAGAAGADGNANVESSVFTILSTDWSQGSATVSVPGLTKEIADNGVVSAFYTTDSLGTDTITWNPLPYSFPAGGANFATVNYNYSIGEVSFTLSINNVSAASFNNDTYARVVLIPSTSLVEGVDVNNYEEVKMVYGIEEYDLN